MAIPTIIQFRTIVQRSIKQLTMSLCQSARAAMKSSSVLCRFLSTALDFRFSTRSLSTHSALELALGTLLV